ncbi:MAG: F0F1 ATP synthase subunit B [Clostridiales Family XIII bacterium]|jgi:F-type H+-transporting ATPase subunit b|nr:F0F1 ATP synthase subunit B [Clostridiales Family XIII bacterium]
MELVAPLIGFDWTLVMVLITFGILYFILKKYFFDKVHSFMEAREQKVIDSFDNAAKASADADAKLAEYSAKLEAAEDERREIIKSAKAAADKRAGSIIDEANEKASSIIKQAEKEAEREKAAAVIEMKEHLALLAVYAAEKILEKELDKSAQRSIIDGIIKEAGEDKWIH